MLRVARSSAVLGARAVARRGFRSSAPVRQAAPSEPLPQRLLSTVNRLVNPVVYYARVALEVVRTAASHQQMSPLALPGQFAEARAGFAGFFSSFSTGTWRTVTAGQLRTMAAVGLQVLGFFTVGEMIGRRNVIGYKVEGARSTAGHH